MLIAFTSTLHKIQYCISNNWLSSNGIDTNTLIEDVFIKSIEMVHNSVVVYLGLEFYDYKIMHVTKH